MIMMGGISRFLCVARMENKIQGIEFSEEVRVTHILFFVDVLFFLGDYEEYDKDLLDILNTFILVTTMVINYEKFVC